MQTLTKYLANDGTEFDNSDECMRHEEIADVRERATVFANNYLRDDFESGTGDPPAQRTVTRVVNVVVAWELYRQAENDAEDNQPEAFPQAVAT